jgi:hypothetical protein
LKPKTQLFCKRINAEIPIDRTFEQRIKEILARRNEKDTQDTFVLNEVIQSIKADKTKKPAAKEREQREWTKWRF